MIVKHVVPHIDEEASGPSYSVRRLCEELNTLDINVELLIIERKKRFNGGIIKSFKSINFLDKIDFSHDLKKYLNKIDISIIHNHGLWTNPNNYAFKSSIKNKIPIISAPRGTLSEWSLNNSKYKKRIYWKLIEKKNLDNVSIFHATSESEAEDIRKLGFRQPISIIPNGVDAQKKINNNSKKKKFKLIFFARIHKKKGIEILINFWEKIGNKLENWELIIAGKGENDYQKKIENKIKNLNLNNFKFIGPIYGNEKFKLLGSSDLYILPTYSENFGLTIAESLSCGTPVITTKQSSWTNLENDSLGWLIDINSSFEEDLFYKLKNINEKELNIMSDNCIKHINEYYNWPEIATKTIIMYEWILGLRDRKPEFIYE